MTEPLIVSPSAPPRKKGHFGKIVRSLLNSHPGDKGFETNKLPPELTLPFHHRLQHLAQRITQMRSPT